MNSFGKKGINLRTIWPITYICPGLVKIEFKNLSNIKNLRENLEKRCKTVHKHSFAFAQHGKATWHYLITKLVHNALWL